MTEIGAGATEPARIREAIERASEELGLAPWYRSCVEPLMALEDADLPRCCGSGCEPCSDTLVSVAFRARALLAAGG